MTRGLSSCVTCAMLYSVLDKAGRCVYCAQRHANLTSTEPTHPDLLRMMQQAGSDLTPYQRRIIKCVCCGEIKPAVDFPPQGTVVPHRRKWCQACMESFVGRRDHKDKPTPRLKPGTKPMAMDDKGRVCAGCKRYKPWDEYGVRRTGTAGRSSRCKPCDAMRFRLRRSAHAGT